MGGSLRVNLNFSGGIVKLLLFVCMSLQKVISGFAAQEWKCVVVNGAVKLHLEFLSWQIAIGSWCQTSCQAML